MENVNSQIINHKTPTSAKVICVCGRVVKIQVQHREEIRCHCGTILWIELEHNIARNIPIIRPAAKVPKTFFGTVLPNTPSIVSPEWG